MGENIQVLYKFTSFEDKPVYAYYLGFGHWFYMDCGEIKYFHKEAA